MGTADLAQVKGMILAAGLGTRMLPLSGTIPKVLLPVAGRPLLEWNLRFLASAGISEVAVNTHHLADSVLAFLEELRDRREGATAERGLPITHFFRETEILGAAGGIAQAAALLDTKAVLIFNAKILFRPDLPAALAQHLFGGHLATLICVRDPLHAQLRLENGRVTAILSRPALDDPSLWAFTGVYFLSAEAVDFLRRGAFVDGRCRYREIVPDFRTWMDRGRLGAVVVTDRAFRAVETPESYWELLRDAEGPLRRELLGESGAPRVTGFGFIEEGADAAAQARVRESAVFRGASIAAGASVSRSILGPGARVTHAVSQIIAVGRESRPLAILSSEEEDAIVPFVLRAEGPGEPRKRDAHPRFRVLHGGGSSRRVVRVLMEEKSRILMTFPEPSAAERAIYPRRGSGRDPTEFDTFLYVAEHLQRIGVRAPRIKASAPNLVLLEDLGDVHLADRLPRGPAEPWPLELTELYKDALRVLLALQSGEGFDPDRTHNLAYDLPFILEYEAGYFHREMVRELCRLDLAFAEMAPCYQTAATAALAEAPRVFMHRDFQSRNLMLTSLGPAVIDFQGARLGPQEYDLASLLLDPYAAIPPSVRDDLLEFYIQEKGARPAEQSSVVGRYRACGINRLLQALGAFAFLGGRLKKSGFLEHVPVALQGLKELTLGTNSRFPELRGAWLPELAQLADQMETAMGGISSPIPAVHSEQVRSSISSKGHDA